MPASESQIISGTIIRFDGNGRSFGYPTANIAAQTNARDGVYFGYASMGEFLHHPSLIFVGVPTTVGSTDRRVEAHLLDIPDKDYYGGFLSVELCHYHRANRTFADIHALLQAMRADEASGRRWFGENNT